MKKRIFGGLMIAAFILVALVACADEEFHSLPYIPGGIAVKGQAPNGLTAIPNGDGSYTLSWKTCPDAVSYNVYRALAPLPDYPPASYKKNVKTNQLRVEQEPGSGYCYWVSSVWYDGGESLLSDWCEIIKEANNE